MALSLPMTWNTLRVALSVARSMAVANGRRYRVIRENGIDVHGAYRFRVLPADECSCYLWTETVGPGLELPCGELHHSCPVHPLETYGNVPVGEPCS